MVWRVLTFAAALALIACMGRVPQLQLAWPPTSAKSAGPAVPARSTLSPDVSWISERATHQLSPVAGRPGVLEMSESGYHARFGPDGFTYTPAGASTGLGVSLSAMRRGGNVLELAPGHWAAEANVATRGVDPGTVERVTAHDGQLEWDFVLDHAPAGRGDLVVTGRLSGLVGGAAQAGSGAHLTLVGGQTVSLGETVIRDARGVELDRSVPTVVDGRVSLVVPDRVLRDAAYPLTVDPTVSDPVSVPGNDESDSVSVAFNGSKYLVAWQSDVAPTANTRIQTSLISADLSSVGAAVEVSTPGTKNRDPDVAWNGSSFLVVWEKTVSSTDHDVLGRRVSGDGQVLGASTITISTPITEQLSPTVSAAGTTAAGSTFYVTWADNRNGNYDIYGARIDNTGTILDPSGKRVTQGTRDEFVPDVAWNGTSFQVVYLYQFSATDPDILGQQVNSSADTILGPQLISTTLASERDPAVASDGTKWLVVWADGRSGNGDIYGTTLTADGVREDQDGFPIGATADPELSPTLAWRGTYLVGYIRSGVNVEVFANRVNGDGTVQDGTGFRIGDDYAKSPSLSPGNGNQWGFAYNDNDGIDFRWISPK
jgi:hypothetical protein